MIDYQLLKNELLNDPNNLGYGPYWDSGQDWKLAELLNQERDTVKIVRETIPAYELFECIVPSEWSTLTIDDREKVRMVLGMGEIKISGSNTKAILQSVFSTSSQTKSNILKAVTRKGSRAEELFGAGVSVSWDDIAKARRI